MRAILTFSLLLLLSTHMLAQKHDNWWLIGYGGGTQTPLNDENGLAMFDFSDPSNVKVLERQQYNMNFSTTAAVMSDSSGNLLFYSNGEKIYAKNHQLMQNGNGIINNPGGYGLIAPQGAIALPRPGHSGQYVLLNLEDNTPSPASVMGWKLYYCIIDMNLNNGLGSVVKKKQLIVQDSMDWGHLTAVKHANGRDWWFLEHKAYSDKFHVGLVTPDTILKIRTQTVDSWFPKGWGQSQFSPDGSKYISIKRDLLYTPSRIDLFDFDRCTGELSNQSTHFPAPDTSVYQGVAFSPDSRWLYVFNHLVVYKYDLHAPDVFATEEVIAEFDGFISGIYPNIFFLGQSGPDGRIYVGSVNTFHFHTVNFPNRSGTDCDFRQHSIYHYIYNDHTIPNFPNYRLGPIDGSPCDTLGIDNHPLANFRYELEDSTEYRRVTFTDLSDYEPNTWHWDFGDGTTSQDTSPVHLYAQDGIYTVCLRVSNAFSADTLCSVVKIGVLASNEPVNRL
ncbi:MAG: PKD domain-containing protein, partial [Saprospiraceae bacterium]|nr:PKD domain-containing protein [Saprospiraceae bacterium]